MKMPVRFKCTLGLIAAAMLWISGALSCRATEQARLFAQFENIMEAPQLSAQEKITAAEPLLRRMEKNWQDRDLRSGYETGYAYHADLLYWVFAEFICGNPGPFNDRDNQAIFDSLRTDVKVTFKGAQIPILDAWADLKLRNSKVAMVELHTRRFTVAAKLDADLLELSQDTAYVDLSQSDLFLAGVTSRLLGRLPAISVPEDTLRFYLPRGEYRLQHRRSGVIPLNFAANGGKTLLTLEPGYYFTLAQPQSQVYFYDKPVARLMYEGPDKEGWCGNKEGRLRFGTYRLVIENVKKCYSYDGLFEVICDNGKLFTDNMTPNTVVIPSGGTFQLRIILKDEVPPEKRRGKAKYYVVTEPEMKLAGYYLEK